MLESVETRIDQVEQNLHIARQQMGEQVKPLYSAMMGGYMSHFMMTMEFQEGPFAGKVVSVVSPLAAQTVSWSDPFIYHHNGGNNSIKVQLPKGSQLPDTINESDFFQRPAEYFQEGRETVWLQILNLSARMKHPEIGDIRIILGETLKREYPDLFMPSLGVAQALSDSGGFPARLFFNPCAVVETSFGAFRAVHGVLCYGRVVDFPPVGTPVSIRQCIPLERVEDVRKYPKLTDIGLVQNSIARIVALSHPIDMQIQLNGQETFDFVERLIAADA